jgi:hypothetical protein
MGNNYIKWYYIFHDNDIINNLENIDPLTQKKFEV